MAQSTRRGILFTMGGAIVAELMARGQHTPQPMPSPNAPKSQNVPAGLDGANIPVRDGERPIPPATWLEIRSEAQKLLDMATDFKKQVNQTNVSATLSLPMLKEAHEIEKMAKKIQRQMKR